jgi:RimJ/RimL family protein N-acetyltransferase
MVPKMAMDEMNWSLAFTLDLPATTGILRFDHYSPRKDKWIFLSPDCRKTDRPGVHRDSGAWFFFASRVGHNGPCPGAAMDIQPITLTGTTVRLEPLGLAHVPALALVGLDPELWRWVPTLVATEAEMRQYVEQALEEQARGTALPFAIVHQASGQVIGSTRYGNIDRGNRRVEIGWTWLARAHQRSGANTEAKLLLLSHAFERLGAFRVEFKTDALNQTSRNAILRLGATVEGTLRRHVLVPRSGRVRDTVYFSILDHEWPAVKARLALKLQGPSRPGGHDGEADDIP